MSDRVQIDPLVVEAINQYFIMTGLNDSLMAFQHECEQRKIKLKKSFCACKHTKLDELCFKKQKLLQFYDKGEGNQFLKLWHTIFVIDGDCSEANILEFYLHIYFALYPLRRTPAARGEYRERLLDLKRYLEEGRGSKLSNNTELVQYFALPYVNEPAKHPLYKDLVQKKWARNLLEKVEHHFERHETTGDNRDQPKLIEWLEASRKMETFKQIEVEYHELQDEYYNLFDIAGELIDYLESSYQGNLVSPQNFYEVSERLSNSKNETERKIQKSVAGNREKKARSIKTSRSDLRKKETNLKKKDLPTNLIPADPKARTSPKNEIQTNEIVLKLNYTKVANQLIKNTSVRASCLLLQALRQRITRVTNKHAKNVLEIFAKNDLLCLRHRKNSVVASIVGQGDAGKDVKEELSRLLNSIASFHIGRNYLLEVNQGKDLLNLLATALKNKKLHHYSGDHALAAMQKLSLRAKVQKELVQVGMVEWLAAYLDPKPSDFFLEYGCALLMNLCLNPASSNAASRASSLLVNTLLKLYKSGNSKICKYLNGILYCTLSVGRVRTRARETELLTVLRTKINHCKDDSSQLPIIIKLINGEISSFSVRRLTLNEENDDWVDDYLEAEIESTDSVKANEGELFGEKLLETKFLLTEPAESLGRDQPEVGDETTAPPGTVPRRSPSSYHQRSVAANNVCGSSVDEIYISDRPISVSSQHTFILENNCRRPLIARDPFNSVFYCDQTDRKPEKMNFKKSQSPASTEGIELISTETDVHSGNSIDQLNDEIKPEIKSKNDQIKNGNSCGSSRENLSEATAIICNSKRIDILNASDYVAIFGPRPRVIRSPKRISSEGSDSA